MLGMITKPMQSWQGHAHKAGESDRLWAKLHELKDTGAATWYAGNVYLEVMTALHILWAKQPDHVHQQAASAEA